MKCPRPDCGTEGQVVDSRERPDGDRRRRYLCAHGHRFSTLEQLAEPARNLNGKPLRVRAGGPVAA